MPENGMPGPVCDLSSVRESVCIHTRKIFDSCRDKDCVEDLRFYPTASAMELLSGCQMVRGGTAELLYVYTDVEPVTFNRGFYSIDMRFFYRVTLQVGTGTPRCAGAEGLCVFDKRCILFGSEGSAKIFSSDTVIDELDIPGRMRTNLPTAVVEAVDPIVLDTRVDDGCKPRCCECGLTEIPAFIARSFGEELVFDDGGRRRFYVTLVTDINEVKLRTRAGMGNCQGRTCGPALAAIAAETAGRAIPDMGRLHVRSPLRPVPLSALLRLPETK